MIRLCETHFESSGPLCLPPAPPWSHHHLKAETPDVTGRNPCQLGTRPQTLQSRGLSPKAKLGARQVIQLAAVDLVKRDVHHQVVILCALAAKGRRGSGCLGFWGERPWDLGIRHFSSDSDSEGRTQGESDGQQLKQPHTSVGAHGYTTDSYSSNLLNFNLGAKPRLSTSPPTNITS